jgi:DNA replication protein DnaD
LFENNNLIPEKISLGLAESVYSLSKKHYGTIQSINTMNVTEFFNLLLKELKDAIVELKAMEKTTTEISDILHISTQTVEKFV